jgi:hypothetical protein
LDTNSTSNFYINGVLQSGFPTQTIPYASFTMNYNYILGDTYGGNGEPGYVDDFRYYDSILTQTDVSVLYNMKGPTNTLILKLYYTFDSNLLINYGSLNTVNNTYGGIITLSYTNYIIGKGSLYQSTSNNTSYFGGILSTGNQNLNGYSFSLWLYLTSTTAGMIFSFDNAANIASQRLYFYSTGSQLRISTGGDINNMANTFPVLNTWNHYVWTLDTNSINNFYINGVLVNKSTNTPSYTFITMKRFIFFGDSLYTSPGNGAQGYMDDFRYYDGILTQTQVSALYNMKGPIITPTLILYYPFNTDISNYTSGTGVTNGSIVGSTVSLSNTNYAVGTGSLYQSASNTTSYFSIPTIPSNTAGFSFSLWIYFYSLNNGMIFTFAAGTGTNNNRIFVSLFSNTIRIGYNAPVPTDTSKNTLITPNLNTWYHYAWTLNTNSNNIFYVNGDALYISNTPAYLSAPLITNRILGSNTTGAPPTNGAQAYLDDFRYYNGILSPTQVTDLYNLKNPQNFNPNTDPALCIYYPFDISRNYVVNYAKNFYGVIDASYASGAGVDYTINKVGTGALKLFSNSYVDFSSNNIAETTDFISPNGMTFSLWIDSSGTTLNAPIFYFGSASAADYIKLIINSSNSISCNVTTAVGNSTVALIPNYNNRIWRHVVWTLGYSSSNTSRWNIYIDSSMVSSTSNNYYPISTTAKTTSRLGSDGGSIYYNGWIDDFRVYQRVLNQLEVTQLYNYVDTSSNIPTLNADAANFSWTPPARNGGVSYNYYSTDNTLDTSSTTINTKTTNAIIPEINIDNSNSYYVNSQRANKQSVYANITI